MLYCGVTCQRVHWLLEHRAECADISLARSAWRDELTTASRRLAKTAIRQRLDKERLERFIRRGQLDLGHLVPSGGNGMGPTVQETLECTEEPALVCH